jgi:hypothetical protein
VDSGAATGVGSDDLDAGSARTSLKLACFLGAEGFPISSEMVYAQYNVTDITTQQQRSHARSYVGFRGELTFRNRWTILCLSSKVSRRAKHLFVSQFQLRIQGQGNTLWTQMPVGPNASQNNTATNLVKRGRQHVGRKNHITRRAKHAASRSES